MKDLDEKESDKKEKKRFFSLRKKIMMMGCILVFLAVLSFAAVGVGQLLKLADVVKKESETQGDNAKMYSDIFSINEKNTSYLRVDKLSSEYLSEMLIQYEMVLSIKGIQGSGERYEDPDQGLSGEL